MKTALLLATHLLVSVPMHIQTYTLAECRELEGFVSTAVDQHGHERIACVFSDGEFAWLEITIDTAFSPKSTGGSK